MNKTIAIGLLAATLTAQAFATEAEVSGAYVRSIAVVGAGFGGHVEGNMEITISATVPSSLACDKTYITTPRSSDPDRAMLAILKEAKARNLPVNMRLTDLYQLHGFLGRCSILAVGLPQ